MKVSEHWLRELADPELSTGELADLLTFGGIEVEAVEPAAPPFDRVVVGEILSVERHPQADRLNVCQVNVGAAPLTIVCGAPNARPGLRAPVALIGAVLPGMEIRQAKVRGVESQGMMCSAKELGISADADGLLELPEDSVIGVSLRDYLDLDDQVLTTKPTPNRGDCLSLMGMAREVRALTGSELRWVAPLPQAATIADTVRVAVDAVKDCPRYTVRVIKGVNARAMTPEWMCRRLLRSGLRPISAIVDVTNYVLLEMGQPMHAFDAAVVRGGIIVRHARAGETLQVLNGETVRLTPQMLVIADDTGPIALAGIMGGATSGVTDGTVDIVLESAFFAPGAIAGKSRELGFGSDSSYRFERGVDFAGCVLALERATRLITGICGGQPGPVTEVVAELPARVPVKLRMARARRILGYEVPVGDARDILVRLGFSVVEQDDVLLATPPSWRFDISIEEDLVEEIARVWGYARIPDRPVLGAIGMLPAAEGGESMTLRRRLAAMDYFEAVTYSFVDAGWEQDFCANSAPVKLANPIASHLSVMRSSLIGGLVNVLVRNASHMEERIRVYEIGRCFLSADRQPVRFAALAFGDALPRQWGDKPRDVDFFDVKGDLEQILAGKRVECEKAEHPAFHPGKCARLLHDGREIGWMGELHPQWTQKYGLVRPVCGFEVDWESLSGGRPPVFQEISKFPVIRRDLAAEFDENVAVGAVLEALSQGAPAILKQVQFFDLYRGEGVENGKKSLAFSVLLQDTAKTLTDADAEKTLADMRRLLQQKFNAKIR
jgi:phenylalanyl-tRNA synthetase beta chain